MLAEAKHVVPGLVSAPKVWLSQPFKALNMEGSLHVTIQTSVLMDTLAALGAKERWASCKIFSTQVHTAAAIAKDGTSTLLHGRERPYQQILRCTWKC